MMMYPLVNMKKVKQVLAENFNVLTLIQNSTHALRIQVDISQSLVNLNQMLKHAMKSRTQTMGLMPQSLKVSTRKVT